MLQAWLARLPSRVASTAGPSAWFLGKPARLPVGHVLALCFRALSRHPSVMRPGVCVRMCVCVCVCVCVFGRHELAFLSLRNLVLLQLSNKKPQSY